MTTHRKLQHKIRRGTGQQARRPKPRRSTERTRAHLEYLVPRSVLASIWSSTGALFTSKPDRLARPAERDDRPAGPRDYSLTQPKPEPARRTANQRKSKSR